MMPAYYDSHASSTMHCRTRFTVRVVLYFTFIRFLAKDCACTV